MSILKRMVIHPFLFAIFPLVFFIVHNHQDVYYTDIPLILLGSLTLSGLLFGILSLLFNDAHKGGVVASVIMFVLLSGGQLYDALAPYYWQYCWMIPVHSKPVYLTLVGLGLIGITGLVAKARNMIPFTGVFTLIAGYMIVAPMLTPNLNLANELQHLMSATKAPVTQQHARSKGALPDVYYLILDGYPGEGVLKKIFQFDNRPFIDALRKQGFYTARYSTSNYVATFLSMASSLNYQYLSMPNTPNGDRREFYSLIKDNRIVRTMKAKGYRIINFSSGYGATERLMWADETINCGKINEFYSVFAKTTLLGVIAPDLLSSGAAQQKLCTFKRLGDIAASPGPKFVFAHIICPHPPYLFGPHGEIRPGNLSWGGSNPVWQQKQPFVDQLTFLNTTLLGVIQRIKQQSKQPPIIIMQGDHGSAATFHRHKDWEQPTHTMINERLHIFNTYHIPSRYHVHLYPTITPVNSFRVLLRDVYGDSIPLLPDANYFSSYTLNHTRYVFQNVTHEVAPW